MLGIRVIACNDLIDLPANRVRILPAGNIDLGKYVTYFHFHFSAVVEANTCSVNSLFS